MTFWVSTFQASKLLRTSVTSTRLLSSSRIVFQPSSSAPSNPGPAVRLAEKYCRDFYANPKVFAPPPPSHSPTAPRAPRMAAPLPPGVVQESVVVRALKDGWPLGATFFQPPKEKLGEVKSAIIFAPATGVPGRFYNGFAAWMASRGHPTLTFDWRLNGGSFPDPANPSVQPSEPFDGMKLTPEARVECLKANPEVGWEEYGFLDFPAAAVELWNRACVASDGAGALRQVRELTMVGNSLGGQMLPLTDWALRNPASPLPGAAGKLAPVFSRALFVGANTPHWGFAPDIKLVEDRFMLIRDACEEEGYMACDRYGLGLPISRKAGRQWMEASAKPNYLAAWPQFSHCFAEYRVPTASIVFDDDHICSGSPRKIDAFSRTLGAPDSVESEAETRYWAGPDGSDTAGQEAYTRNPAPEAWSEEGGRRPRDSFLNTRLFYDVEANGWVQGSAWPTRFGPEPKGKDPRPKLVSHVEPFRSAVFAGGNSPSAEVWDVFAAFLDERRNIPAADDERVCAGKGSRRDFGPALDRLESFPLDRRSEPRAAAQSAGLSARL